MSILLSLLLISSSYAQDCDAKALGKALGAARGADIPTAYVALVDCDLKAAKAQAKTTLGRVKTGAGLDTLAVAVARTGAWTELRPWVAARTPELRTTIATALSEACAEDANVAGWYVDSARVEKAKFWTNGAWRELGECRQPAVQELLRQGVTTTGADRTMWLDQLEVYGHNAGAEALEFLGGILAATTDAAEAERVLAALLDAGAVGGEEAQPQVVEALSSAGATAPIEVLPAMRAALAERGAKGKGDAFAARFYADRAHADGSFHYGVVAVERATCKRKKTFVRTHTGEAVDAQLRWPDQVIPSVEGVARKTWTIKLVKECGGSGSTDVRTSPEPLSSEGIAAWVAAEVAKVEATEPDKLDIVAESAALKP